MEEGLSECKRAVWGAVGGEQLPEDAQGPGLGLNLPNFSCFSGKKAHKPPGSVKYKSFGLQVRVSCSYLLAEELHEL